MDDWGKIAGVDEAGRGPLAGPVIAAAVILDPRSPILGLKDSKQLSPSARERLAVLIRQQAIATAIGRAEVEEIDALNILQATMLAMQRAVAALAVPPLAVWVDGNRAPLLTMPTKTIIRGDETVPSISAASILAKVARDQEMRYWDRIYPAYGLAQHKGYPTQAHAQAIRKVGSSPIHRKTFRVPEYRC